MSLSHDVGHSKNVQPNALDGRTDRRTDRQTDMSKPTLDAMPGICTCPSGHQHDPNTPSLSKCLCTSAERKRERDINLDTSTFHTKN